MSEQQHTPEPWAVDKSPYFGQWYVRQNPVNWDGAGYQHICSTPADKKGTHYGDMFAANANRIVAYVNACAGVPNSILHSDAFIDLSVKLTEVATQRDQLLSQLKNIRELIDGIHAPESGFSSYVQLANIARAKPGIDAAIKAAEAK